MTAIPFPISSAPGVKPHEGAGRLINCRAEKTELGSRAPVLWRRAAGMNEMIDVSSHVHLRGAIMVGSTMVAVFDERVYAVEMSGPTLIATNLGELQGTGRVTIARNRAATPDIVAVTEDGAFSLYVNATPIVFADSDVPFPLSVCNVNGYFIFVIGDGRIIASELNSVSVATNSFVTYQNRPGGLLVGVTFGGELIVFGRSGGAVYRDEGTSPFPLKFVTDISHGIIGTFAIAGWEEGWSNQLIWVGDDNVVYRLNGYVPEAISSDDVTRIISAAAKAQQGDTLEASVHMEGRNAIWRLTNPGEWTWEYNTTTGNWNERKSYNREDCRASCSIKAFGRWIAGDRVNGKLYEILEGYYREGDEHLQYILRSGSYAAFPSRLKNPRMDFDFTAAVGMAAGEDPIETDPWVLIRWSKDGGYSFGNPVTRRLGAEGVGNNRVTVLRGPQSGPKGIVVEVEVSDPVHAGFLGGQSAIVPLAE